MWIINHDNKKGIRKAVPKTIPISSSELRSIVGGNFKITSLDVGVWVTNEDKTYEEGDPRSVLTMGSRSRCNRNKIITFGFSGIGVFFPNDSITEIYSK